jgi:amino acid permease
MRYFVTRLCTVLTLIGIVLVLVGVVYLSTTATQLPSFFPGHLAHAKHPGVYSKRGIAALLAAGVCFFVSHKESEKAMSGY